MEDRGRDSRIVVEMIVSEPRQYVRSAIFGCSKYLWVATNTEVHKLCSKSTTSKLYTNRNERHEGAFYTAHPLSPVLFQGPFLGCFPCSQQPASLFQYSCHKTSASTAPHAVNDSHSCFLLPLSGSLRIQHIVTKRNVMNHIVHSCRWFDLAGSARRYCRGSSSPEYANASRYKSCVSLLDHVRVTSMLFVFGAMLNESGVRYPDQRMPRGRRGKVMYCTDREKTRRACISDNRVGSSIVCLEVEIYSFLS